jgi:polar amino acid transport system permease protein
MIFDLDYALSILPEMLEHFLRYTLVLTILATIVAASLGLVFAIIRWLRVPVLSQLVWVFIEFIRSTPIVVQLFVLFYALPNFGITLPPMTAAVIGFGVHYACYYAEVYRAGIVSVPMGQWEASTAVHLPPGRTWRRVILPQAIRNVLPSLGNYAIAMFKETPFAALILVPELVFTAKEVATESSRFVEPITLAGLIFLAASYPTAVLLRRLEGHLETSPVG